MEKVASSELKHLFTIHLFTFFFYSLKENKGRSTRYKHEKSKKHTIVHGCNPSKQGVSVEVRCSLEIKSKNGKFVLVGVKTPIHLFTYSPIHFHLLAGSLSIPFSFYPLLEKGEQVNSEQVFQLGATELFRFFILCPPIWK